MEPVKTSFIPKTTLAAERPVRPSGSANLFQLVGIILLIIAIAAAAGVFAYTQITKAQIQAKKDSLERAREAFEPATIKELARLDGRLSAAGTLLNSHLAPSKLFEAIESATLTSVRFEDFQMAESGPGVMTVTMHGTARSFNAVALQSDAFTKNPVFSSPIFSDLNLDEVGNAVFSFSATVNTNELLYVPHTAMTPPATTASTTP